MIKYQELGYNGFAFHRLIGFPEIDLDAAAASYGLTNKQHDGAMPYYAVAASQVETLEADGITEASTSQVDEIRDYYT